jgi:predicted dienelactone hydrolase
VADPALPGPWRVGVKTITVIDEARGRELPVEVWYPADGEAPGGQPNRYQALGELIDVETEALRDAVPASGTFPLVLFSHGYGGIRFQSYFITEHLASHGWVVAAPDHPGNTLLDFGQLGDDEATAQSAIDRPVDMQVTLDRLLAGAAGVTVDGGRVAATGHSFGGWTCLELARRDDRIRAVFPMAPGFREGSTPDMVAELERPLFIFGGSEDDTCPFATDQKAPYDLAARPRYLIQVTGAGHLDFSNLCEVPIAQAFVDDGCDPAQIEPTEVHARVVPLATAFLGLHVAGQTGYGPYLEVDPVLAMNRVEYWRDP